jgi:hypothetical protein
MQRLKRFIKVIMIAVVFLVVLGSIGSFLDRGSFRASAQSLTPKRSSLVAHPAASEIMLFDLHNPTVSQFSGCWSVKDAADNTLVGPTCITVQPHQFYSASFTTLTIQETFPGAPAPIMVQTPYRVELTCPQCNTSSTLSQFARQQPSLLLRDINAGTMTGGIQLGMGEHGDVSLQ